MLRAEHIADYLAIPPIHLEKVFLPQDSPLSTSNFEKVFFRVFFCAQATAADRKPMAGVP